MFPKICFFLPPKSSILIGFSIIFTVHFGGFPPIFGLTPIYQSKMANNIFVERKPSSSSSQKIFGTCCSQASQYIRHRSTPGSKYIGNWKMRQTFPFYQQEIIAKSLIGHPFEKHISFESEAIYTGSAVVVNGAGPNGAPGIVQIYPGQR